MIVRIEYTDGHARYRLGNRKGSKYLAGGRRRLIRADHLQPGFQVSTICEETPGIYKIRVVKKVRVG